MRIKKLELIGFKSFKDRTVIHFDAGITGIVGPNGCGKSNIVDALVWVMGEQSAKHLRGSAMQDVIFGGSEDYAPSGLAEVSLTLEDDGGAFPTKYLGQSEIMVTRRLHRSGESEYLLNKEQARLRDIQEIFMDTGAGAKGFSIIEQGAIGKIITAKPLERRSLIEEAAGITKFKVRKRESVRKLQNTEQNLVRLNDIVSELKRRIDSLQRQAKKAERYRQIKEELEDLDLWLSSKKFLELKEIADEAQSLFESVSTSEEVDRNEIDMLEKKIESLKNQNIDKENELEQKTKDYDGLKEQVVSRDKQLQELRFEVEQGLRKEEMTGSLVSELRARQELLSNEHAQFNEKFVKAKDEAVQLTKDFETKNDAFQNIHISIDDIDNELTEKRRRLVAVTQSQSAIEGQVEVLESHLVESEQRESDAQLILEELKAKLIEFDHIYKETFKKLEESRQMQLDIMKDVENFKENKNILQDKVEQKRIDVNTIKDEFNSITSRLYGLENLDANFEGFQEGVKNLMLWQREKAAPETEMIPVSDIVTVAEKYELAMEAALGNHLQLLLSKDTTTSLAAVEHLKTNNLGRSSFLSSNSSDSIAELEIPTTENGVEGRLISFINAKSDFQHAIEQLIGDVVVVDKIQTAVELHKQYKSCTFVSLEGDILSSRGVLTGGTVESADSGILKRRREIKELSAQREEVSNTLKLAEIDLKKLQEKLDAVVASFELAQKNHTEQEIRVTELKKDVERSEMESNSASKAVEKQNKEVDRFIEATETLRAKLKKLTSDLQERNQEKQNLEQEVEKLTENLQNSKLGIDGLQEEVTQLKVLSAEKRQEAEGIERQLQMVQNSLDEVNTKLSSMSEESEENSSQLSNNQLRLQEERVQFESFKMEVEEFGQKLKELKESFEEEYSEVRVVEDELNNKRKAFASNQSQMNEAQLKSEQARMKEEYLVEQILERYQVQLNDVAEGYRDREGDVDGAEAKVEELRSRIKRIGEVNLSAIEEYDETIERYEFLSQQQEDLLTARKELNRVIDRINRICSRRFKDTFEQVNERFQKAFPVLFGGGEARLILIEDEDKDEMGIDIIAKPPGKKPQSVTLLSGGEKALTAVALIFSIFLVKPSPYCLLDEVDAPLDDANVYRFNDLVREMAKRSQIIIVTHNKHTMEINKKLYGVTQQEKGVSKMVSVNIDDAARLAQV